MYEINASDARSRFADIYDNAVGYLPTSIRRRRGSGAVLVGEEVFDQMLSRYEFAPEVFFEAGKVAIWLPELKVWGRGDDFGAAQEDLLDEIDEFLALVEGDASVRTSVPVRALAPWIYRLSRTSTDDKRLEVLFAAPGVTVEAHPAAAIASR